MNDTAQIDFWEERYKANQTGWDIGEPAPPFIDYLNESDAPKAGRVCVPGCGRGHDALYLAQRGFEVVGVDFAPSAVEFCQQRAAELGLEANTDFIMRDVFELLPEYSASFDYILEYTCYCAIPIEARPRYVQLLRGLLKPGGKVIATFFTHGRPGGPPFDTNPAELHQLFDPYFEFERLEKPARSAPSRTNEETFGLLRLK